MLKDCVQDVVSLFYPRLCFSCDSPLLHHEECLCTECLYLLPQTHFHLMADNPVANQFVGKININAAASYYYFTKGGKVQHLIHQFKYLGFKKIGQFIGSIYGEKLMQSPMFNDISYIVPIPLHPKKEAFRGYNQAEWFARGLAIPMKAEVDTTSLVRITASETQTHKARFSRWENVKEIFALKNTQTLAGKHVLLVDDVITTGSTIEAAGQVLMSITDIRISICSIACALH